MNTFNLYTIIAGEIKKKNLLIKFITIILKHYNFASCKVYSYWHHIPADNGDFIS